jgi:hypothetical protein
MAAVHVMTKMTATPKPKEDRTSLEMERKGHNPRKLVKRILFVKMAAKKRVDMSI